MAEPVCRSHHRLLQANLLAAQDCPLLLCVPAEALGIVQRATELRHLLHQVLAALQPRIQFLESVHWRLNYHSVLFGSFWNVPCSAVPLQSHSSSLAPLTRSPVCAREKKMKGSYEVRNCFKWKQSAATLGKKIVKIMLFCDTEPGC